MRYTLRRYPCCRIPIFGSACFSAYSCTRPTSNIRHYRPALRPGGHLFRSGCTSYAVSSYRLSIRNPPALPSYLSFLWGRILWPYPTWGRWFPCQPSASLIQATALLNSPASGGEIPVWANSPGTKEKAENQRINSLFLIRPFCLKDRFPLSAEWKRVHPTNRTGSEQVSYQSAWSAYPCMYEIVQIPKWEQTKRFLKLICLSCWITPT